MLSTTIKTLFIFSAILITSSCGSGSSSAPAPEKPQSSNWDEMHWDTDNWSS